MDVGFGHGLGYSTVRVRVQEGSRTDEEEILCWLTQFFNDNAVADKLSLNVLSVENSFHFPSNAQISSQSSMKQSLNREELIASAMVSILTTTAFPTTADVMQSGSTGAFFQNSLTSSRRIGSSYEKQFCAPYLIILFLVPKALPKLLHLLREVFHYRLFK